MAARWSALEPGARALAARGALALLPGEIGTLRARPDPAGPLGQAGSLEVRLAETPREVRRAQRLRYRVFFEEMSAQPSPAARMTRRDRDEYDAVCDHLLVLDHAVAPRRFRAPRPRVVGTYRLLRRDVAEAGPGFYSAREFDLRPLLQDGPAANLLELGRSCVLASHRGRRTVELLWQGLWAYALRHGVDAMIGCASLEGTDVGRLAPQLGFLHHHAAAAAPWRVSALPERRVAMDALGRDSIDARAAFKALPPLVKGYLRLGATFGDGAVVDHAFGTTDVFVVLPVEAIRDRYVAYFAPAANRLPA